MAYLIIPNDFSLCAISFGCEFQPSTYLLHLVLDKQTYLVQIKPILVKLLRTQTLYLEIEKEDLLKIDATYTIEFRYWSRKNCSHDYKIYETMICVFDPKFINMTGSSKQYVVDIVNKLKLQNPSLETIQLPFGICFPKQKCIQECNQEKVA